jgi:hypothetical protein
MQAIVADAVEVGRRLSASRTPGLRQRTWTPAQRRRLLSAAGGVIGAVLAASVAVHSWGAPDQPVRAPYTPPATTAASAADPGVPSDPAGLSGVRLQRVAVATPQPLRPPPPLPPPPLSARLVLPVPGPSRARPPVHRVVGPPPAAPLPAPPEVVAAPLLTPAPSPH